MAASSLRGQSDKLRRARSLLIKSGSRRSFSPNAGTLVRWAENFNARTLAQQPKNQDPGWQDLVYEQPTSIT